MSDHVSHSAASDHHAAPYHSHARQFMKIFIALAVLTVITVAVSRVDFGAMNTVVAMIVASIKAMLVAIFFMHLSHEDKTTWLYAIFPILLMFLLLGMVFLDNPYRINPDGNWEYPLPKAAHAPAAAVHH